MRKLFLTALLLIAATLQALAVPASPKPYTYRQPDGSVITLVNHGDEFDSWVTCGGVEVELGADGFYRPVSNAAGKRIARRAAAVSLRSQAARLRTQARSEGISHGNKRFLVLLIEFPDRKFTTPDARSTFFRMLNESAYADDGGTGSVKDYYTDNSGGLFVPAFDVFGPVEVSRSYAYYGEDSGGDRSAHATEALREACEQLDEEINFSQYDNDGDGYVDNTFFFFAGHSQAEGADAGSIWPHQWSMPNGPVLDGTRVSRYGCASEYKGNEGAMRAGIGTFCHEFGHSLGLIDFYDTDGDTNGRALDLSRFSLMCNGNYLNDGRTPPCLTSIEKQMLGWMDSFREITASGSYTLGPLRTGTVPYITAADVDGEYFLYEMRDGKGWDAYLPEGLIVYHIDRSENQIAPGVSARQAWDSHYVNRYGDHPCIYLVPSSGYGSSNLGTMVYPGNEGITSFVPLAWSGNNLPFVFSGISVSGGQAHFSLECLSPSRQIFGTVVDGEGKAIEGATITVGPLEAATSPTMLRTNRVVPRSAEYTALTDASGNYRITLPDADKDESFRISAAKEGYVVRTSEISVKHLKQCDFVLRMMVDAPEADLRKFPEGGTAYGRGYVKKPQDIMGAVHFSVDELRQYGGMYLESVSFQYAEAEPYACQEAYVIVDQGGERVLTQRVDNPAPYQYVTVDISAAKIQVKKNKDLYIGYALKGVNASYPVLRKQVSGLKDGSYISEFSLSRSSWSGEEGQAVLVSATLVDTDIQGSINLSWMGYNSIYVPEKLKAGDSFPFRLNEAPADRPASIEWFCDGTPQTGGSSRLDSGLHSIKAILTFPDGTTEVLFTEVNVQ